MQLKISLSVLLFALVSHYCHGQIAVNSWESFDEKNIPSDLQRGITPSKYHASKIDMTVLRQPLSQTTHDQQEGIHISLPMPDGSLKKFEIQRNQIMPESLAKKYPEIMSFTGTSIDDAQDRLFLDVTPKGLHAMIKGSGRSIFIDPYFSNDDSHYSSYFKSDFAREVQPTWSCQFDENDASNAKAMERKAAADKEFRFEKRQKAAVVTKVYRLAVTTTPEYTGFFGGTVADGLAAVVTAINRVSGVYETEVGVQLTLVPNNDIIIYDNNATAQITNANASLGRCQSVIDANIGAANYDIGHVFVSTGGGVASLGVVCINGSKGRGLTGLPNPTGDPFYIDYVSHEMGHQFDGLHTFNGDSNSCSGGNRSGSAAYEPGSGATIQAYAGICGNDNIQNNSDAYFHLKSLMEITDLINGSAASCAQEINMGNNMPTANANFEGINGKSIPAQTPFELIGEGSDIDGNNLTYQWDQWNLGPQRDLNAPDNGSSPIIRSFFATNSKTRVFPRLNDLLNNTTTVGERLPTADWASMNFQFTVRDNRGGWMNDMISLTVVSAAGPFEVTSLNGGGTVSGTINVTWNVAGTDANGINCANVDVLLSTDGGQTYSIVLEDDIPNNGSTSIDLDEFFVDNARIKIKCSDNVFFDVNDAPFVIEPTSVPCNTFAEITDNPIADGIYSSNTELSSSGGVPAAGDVIFTGTTAVNILEDFEVSNTGVLEARIYPCLSPRNE